MPDLTPRPRHEPPRRGGPTHRIDSGAGDDHLPAGVRVIARRR